MITKIVDIETDDIDASLIHCIAIGDTEGKVIVYADSLDYPPLSEGIKIMEEDDRFVMHNGLNFDYPVILRLTDAKIKREKIFDTLVTSRFLDPKQIKH